MNTVTSLLNCDKKSSSYKAFVGLMTFSIFSLSAIASQATTPRSMKHVEDIFHDPDTIYGHFVVSCFNGKNAEVSYWEDDLMWCVGKGEKKECTSWRYNAAEKACAASLNSMANLEK